MTHKLYFRYGAMGSSKSANLLMTAYNYDRQNKKVIVLKPNIDTRDDPEMIISRSGLKRVVDYMVYPDTNIYSLLKDEIDCDCILVDEVQFLTINQIDDLRMLTKLYPVICYGLRTDYTGNLFSGSKRLFELADSIEEIKTTCMYCNKKAIINARYITDIDRNGNKIEKIIKTTNDKDVIDIGGDDKYIPLCWLCWFEDNYDKEEYEDRKNV